MMSAAGPEQLGQFDIGLGTILSILITLGVAYILATVVDRLLQALADRLAAERFRVLLLIPVLKVGIYGLAAYGIVSLTVDPSAEQLLAFSGLFGAALGFGFKELFTDVLGGLSILFERPYRMGDKIAIGEHYGEVVAIGLRSTQLVTPNDNLVTIPNDAYFSESIANATAGNAEMLVTIEFHVAAAADPTTATQLVEEAIITSPYVYVTDNHPAEVHLADNRSYFTLTGKAYVNDCGMKNASALMSQPAR
jgi:Small-conductance mechanosensitive channel